MVNEPNGEGFAVIPTWMLRCGDFSKSELIVYLHFASYAGSRNLSPSQEWLAHLTGYSVRTVRDAIAGLVDKGVLERNTTYRRGASGGRRNDRYRLVSAPWFEDDEAADFDEGLPADFAGKEGVTGKKRQGLPAKNDKSLLFININNNNKYMRKNSANNVQDVDAAFEEWYSIYPRKRQRANAAKAFHKAWAKVNGDLDVLLNAVRAMLPEWQAMKATGHGDKIPYPATWLNREGWADDIEPPSAAVNVSGREPDWNDLVLAGRAVNPQPQREQWKSIEELMAEADRQEHHVIESGNYRTDSGYGEP